MMDIEKIKKNKSIQELLEFSILNIDKPSGPTSFQVDELIKKSLSLKKTSHFGTLDPKVTGVLPVALNRACKLSEYFMHRDKEYVGIMHLHKNMIIKRLQEVIAKEFVGKIKQIPPKRSKVKRQEREREVKKFEILEKKEKDVLFLTEVEAGTYVRKLCWDLGQKIGGAHMTELRRVKAGIFSEQDKNFINLYDFQKAVEEYKKGDDKMLREILIPADEAIKKILPVVQVKEEAVSKLLTGKPIFKQDLEEKEIENIAGEKFVVFFKDKFIEVARKTEETNEGDIIARPEFVMQPMK